MKSQVIQQLFIVSNANNHYQSKKISKYIIECTFSCNYDMSFAATREYIAKQTVSTFNTFPTNKSSSFQFTQCIDLAERLSQVTFSSHNKCQSAELVINLSSKLILFEVFVFCVWFCQQIVFIFFILLFAHQRAVY